MTVPLPVHPAPRWKTIILPGLRGGILLTLIQLGMAFLGTGPGARPGFPFLPHSNLTIAVLVWLMYLVIPAVQALLITGRTQQFILGAKVGKLAGRVCAVVFILATILYPLAPSMDLVAPSSTCRLSPMCGFGNLTAVFITRALAVGYHLIGIQLATLGAFLGSQVGRREPFPLKVKEQ
jgi:hypothetical protein